jgi:hypothetical protein
MLPVTCRSDDRIDAGGFAFGALALNSFALGAEGAVDAEVDADGLDAGASCFGAGSLILLLENIVCSLDKDHGIYSLATNTNFIVKVNTGYPS